MSRPKTTQELIHWLEVGGGARWIRLGAVLMMVLVLSLRVAWTQFHGPLTETTLLQADMGRQLASGAGFTTLVNFPQTAALMAAKGQRFDPRRPYPELTQAPLYALVVAGGLRVLPAGVRESLFATLPVDGFRADYFLLGLNLGLFWLAVWLTFYAGRRIFSPRVGWLAALALLVSVSSWQQVVAVNGVPLMMVLALLAFLVWHKVECGIGDDHGAAVRPAWLAALGALCGLLFLAEYSAGVLVLVSIGYALWRFRQGGRLLAVGAIAGAFALLVAPWIVRNARLTGNPVALAAQNIAFKAGDPTAEPAVFRDRLSADAPKIDLNKLGNKALTSLQDNVKSRLWAGGGLFLTAFFVAGWLYTFRTPSAERMRWLFTATLAALVTAQAFLNSGETERLPVFWLSPLIIIFGSGFFFVLLDASPNLAGWPRLAAAILILAQGVPLGRDALQPPPPIHFNYPPYYPWLLLRLRMSLEQLGAMERFGVMADIPAGAAWYGRQRVWAQPTRLKDFYGITVDQPMAYLILTPRTLDRPFFSELAVRGPLPGSFGEVTERFGEWGQIYSAFLTGRIPPEFPLTSLQKIMENFYVLSNPTLPPARGK